MRGGAGVVARRENGSEALVVRLDRDIARGAQTLDERSRRLRLLTVGRDQTPAPDGPNVGVPAAV